MRKKEVVKLNAAAGGMGMRGFYGIIANKSGDKWVFGNGVVPKYAKVLELVGLKDENIVCIETPGAVPFYKVEIGLEEPSNLMEPEEVKFIVDHIGSFTFIPCGYLILFSDGERWLPSSIKKRNISGLGPTCDFDSSGWALDRVCQDLIRVAIENFNEKSGINLSSDFYAPEVMSLRHEGHRLVNKIVSNGVLDKGGVYRYLGRCMKLDKDSCHFSKFNGMQCRIAIEWLNKMCSNLPKKGRV